MVGLMVSRHAQLGFRPWSLVVSLCLAAGCAPKTPAIADGSTASSHAQKSASDWRAITGAMQRAKGGALVLFDGKAPSTTLSHVRLTADPQRSVSAERHRILELARREGVRHVLRIRGRESWQAFPRDPLAPWTLGLPAVIAADEAHLAEDHAIAETLRRALQYASRFDYVAAADEIDILHKSVGKASAEAGWRARLAIGLFERAGVARRFVKPLAPVQGLPSPIRSPYAAWLAIRVSETGRKASFSSLMDRVKPHLDERRAAITRRLHDPVERCPADLLVPMERPSDLVFLGPFSRSLRVDSSAPKPRLELDEWLKAYHRAEQFVTSTGTYWAHAAHLLRQRGRRSGLSASGTATYRRVTERSLQHVGGLLKLARGDATRFRAAALTALSYLPGTMRDRRLYRRLNEGLSGLVALQIQSAQTERALLEAGFSAVASIMASPPAQQAGRLDHARGVFGRKLDSDFATAVGWRMAGLRLGEAVTATFAGDARRLRSVLPALRATLDFGRLDGGAEIAPFMRVLVKYAELGAAGQLDASVTNPKMLSPERREAQSALATALRELAPRGPSVGPEREFWRDLSVLADGLLAAAVATVHAEDKSQCEGQRVIGGGHPLRDTLDRLRKRQQRIRKRRAFKRGDSTWLRRARAIAVLLTDCLDLVDRTRGKVRFRLARTDAVIALRSGLTAWTGPKIATQFASAYALATAHLGEERVSGAFVREHLPRALAGVDAFIGSPLFGDSDTTMADGRAAGPADAQVPALFLRYSEAARKAGDDVRADLMSLLALTVASGSEHPLPAHRVAAAKGTAAELPIALHQSRFDVEVARILPRLVRESTAASCSRPNPDATLLVRKALAAAREGKLGVARKQLAGVLRDAQTHGLDVALQQHVYLHQHGPRLLKLATSFSLGQPLLRGAHQFNLSLGIRSQTERERQIEISWADPRSSEGLTQAARYFAHASAVASLLHGVQSPAHSAQPKDASRFARNAIDSWIHGTRLGPRAARGEDWIRDARFSLPLLAQQAADRGDALLSGDLWTLARRALGKTVSDAQVAGSMSALPHWLRGIPGLDALRARASSSLKVAASTLPCTSRMTNFKPWRRVGCHRYPLALGLRVAEALPLLPILVRHAERHDATAGRCKAWRSLDQFLSRMQQGSYDPDALVAAITALRKAGRLDDAAVMLTRHRKRQHCSPTLVAHARALGGSAQLGLHLRADALSVALNCGGDGELAATLSKLDRLTVQFVDLGRNFQVLLFAARVATQTGNFDPLGKLTRTDGFLARYTARGPAIATTALLLHEAARPHTQPVPSWSDDAYRLLCGTVPTKERGPSCQAIALLRGEDRPDARRRLARRALSDGLQRWLKAAR